MPITHPSSQGVVMKARRSIRGIAIAASVGLIGCSSDLVHKHVPAFSAAVTSSMTSTQNAFEIVETEFHQAEVSEIVNKYDLHEPIDFNKDLAPFLSDDQLEARLKVLKGLQRYGALLSALTGSTQLDALDKSTTDLGTSLQTLNTNAALNYMASGQTSQVVTSNDIALFTTAVNAIGHWLIEWKRQRALSAIVPKMDKYVGDICDIFAKDIGDSDTHPGLRSALKHAYEKEMQERDGYIQTNLKNFTTVEKRAEIETIVALQTRRMAADKMLDSVGKTLQQLKKTHHALAKAVQTPKPDLPELAILISDLKAEGERIVTYDKAITTGLSE